MEIKTEIIEDNKELTGEQRDNFAKQLADKFQQWDEDRQTQIDTAREIMREVYLNQPVRKLDGELAWKSDVKLNGLYNIKRAIKAMMWREMWANPSQMFDVRGTDERTQQLAKLQKAAIVDSLNKMDVGKQFDEGIDNLLDIGEIILKTDWEQRKKIVKRQIKGVGFILMNVLRSLKGAGYEQIPLQDVEVPIYENARVESISPFMFVFDYSKYKLRNKDSWDSCIKIYKRFENLDNIKANKVYKITDDMLADLKNIKEDASENKKELVDLRDYNEYSGQYSVLYAHGDFKIEGKLYKNYIAEVLAGKYLIRFEENPMYINPFILCALEYDPLTKRGISKLKASKDMCREEETLTNVAFDVQKLTANPSYWVNEGLLTENNTDKNGNIVLAPGKIFEIESGYAGSLPNAIEVSANGIETLLALLTQKISDISSVNANMYGNVTQKDKTATELSLADKGATAQSGKDLDTIYQDCTIPMVKNVAELLAMFKDGTDFVYAQEKGKNTEYKITNEIRQAEYNYIYEDRNAIFDRKSKFQEVYNLFNAIGQNPELFAMVNWREVITTALEMTGFDNTEKFLQDETPAMQFAQQLNQIPPEMQKQIVQMFSQQLTQLQQQYQQQQQEQQMQTRANQQVQMNMYRQQARENALTQNINPQ